MKKLLYVLIAFLFVTLNVESVKADTLEKSCYYSYKDNNGVETKYTLNIYRKSGGGTKTTGTITMIDGVSKNNSENINNWTETSGNGYNPSESYDDNKTCPPYIYIKDTNAGLNRYQDVKAYDRYNATYKLDKTMHYYLQYTSSSANEYAYPKGEISDLEPKSDGVVYWTCQYTDSISDYKVKLYVYADGTFDSKVINKTGGYSYIAATGKVSTERCPDLWMSVSTTGAAGNRINTYTKGGNARNKMTLDTDASQKSENYIHPSVPKELYKTCNYESSNVKAVLKIYNDYSYELSASGMGVSYPIRTEGSLNSYTCPTLKHHKVVGESWFEINKPSSSHTIIPLEGTGTTTNAYDEYIGELKKDEQTNVDNSTFLEECDYLENSELFDFLQKVLTIIKIAGPVLAVVLGMLDFAKAILASDADKELKTAWHHFIYRLMAAGLLFLIPALLSFLMNVIIPSRATNNPYCDLITVYEEK